MKFTFASLLTLSAVTAATAIPDTSSAPPAAYPIPTGASVANGTSPAPPNVFDELILDMNFGYGAELTDRMVRFVRDKANSTVVGFLFGDDEEENKEESTNIGADGGNPHQRYHYKQISENTECNDGPCELVQSIARTSGMGFSGEVGIPLAGSAGFTVTREKQVATVPNCQSMAPGDVLCVWYRQAYTTYETSNLDDSGKPILITLPNAKKIGSAFVCGRNERCTFESDEFWSSSSPSGPPMKYPFKQAWQ